MQQTVGPNTNPKLEPENTEDTNQTLRFIYDSHQKWFWDSTNSLAKGITFYFAITAVLLGYVLTKELQAPLQKFILLVGLITSVLFFVAAWTCIWGLLNCIGSLQRLSERIDLRVFQDLEIHRFFSSSRRIIWTISICSSLVGIMFMIGIIILLTRIAS